jgi:hypothetical protein
METINLRQNLIDSISTLPNDMLEEMYKFLNFLEYKKSSNSETLNQEAILNEFKESIKDIKKLKNGDKSMLYSGSLDDMIRELQ